MVALCWIPLQADAFRGQRFSLLVRKTMLTVRSSAVTPASTSIFKEAGCFGAVRRSLFDEFVLFPLESPPFTPSSYKKKQTIYAKKTPIFRI
jgi:hypothetical protein